MGTQLLPIDFWFSLASTYTYLSVTRMADVVQRTGAEIRWRPFNVRSIMIEQNNIPFRTKPVKLAYMWRDLERRAALHGVPYAGAPPYPLRDVTLSDRAAMIAAREGWCPTYMPAIYRRWFIGQRDVSDEPDIATALIEVGQDPARVLTMAKMESAEQALVEATDTAKRLGVFGSPTFVAGPEVFWGDDRLEQAIDWSRGSGRY
ncbi:MAG: 2-hydroxychromene-2-carboxylate isomerase [Proteobacteria bacterium]|nr:2-hydroxychromene-2-carboxylate isomerase [Pseudomonadota bacterium]